MENERDEKKKTSGFSLDDKRFEEIEKMIDATVELYKTHTSINPLENAPANLSMENNIHEETPPPMIKPEIKKPDRKIYPRIPFKFPKIRVRLKKETKKNNHTQPIKIERLDKIDSNKNIKTSYNQQTDLKSKRLIEEKMDAVGDRILLDEDVKKLLVIVDDLLGELPDEVIKKFVESDDFLLYEKVMKKYNIK